MYLFICLFIFNAFASQQSLFSNLFGLQMTMNLLGIPGGEIQPCMDIWSHPHIAASNNYRIRVWLHAREISLLRSRF